MFKPKSYYYLIDSLNESTAILLKKALTPITAIVGLNINTISGVIEVKSKQDVEEKVRIACGVAGISFRTKIKKKDIY